MNNDKKLLTFEEFMEMNSEIVEAMKRAEKELRELNLSLEQRVTERTSELAHTVEVLQEEISQRVRAENELKLAYEQLAQRADQLRRLAGELTAIEQTERKRLSRILLIEVKVSFCMQPLCPNKSIPASPLAALGP
jgi:hypothetical protein